MKSRFYPPLGAVFSLLVFPTLLFSQITIGGKVTDPDNRPLGFAGVALVQARDTQWVKGAITDENGIFSIAYTGPGGEFRLLATLLGHEPTLTDVFTVQESNKTVTADITLHPAANVLTEAVVEAKRPLFEQKADRLVVNVANSPVAAGGSAMEILQKVPGVLVIQDRVTLAGNQSVQIWIDGKPSQYADMNAVLRDLPGDQIDRIELITQPGARYDAAGGAIINIILKRNAELGFTGTAALTLGGSMYDQTDAGASASETYYRYAPNLSLNYRGGQWNLFGSYSHARRTGFEILDIDRFIGTERYEQTNFTPSEFQVHNYRAGADFFATNKTTVGVLVRGFTRDGDSRANNVTQVFNLDEPQPFGAFTTENNSNTQRSNIYGNVNLRHEFNARTGHTLNVDADFSRFDIQNRSLLNIYQNEPGSPESRSEQDLDQPIRIAVGKVDYTLPLDTTFKLEMGAKASFATIDNDLRFLRGTVLDTAQSNDFLYRENINAAYLNASKKLGRFDFNAGLRTEQTVVSGETAGQQVLDRNYWQLFPSASAVYNVNEHFALQTSYSRRVNRPGFQQQNPFAFFLDSLTYQQGNPQLRPEISNNAQLAVTYDGQPFFRVSYGRTDDVIVENAPRLEGTKTFTQTTNLAQYERWAFELNFPLKFKNIIDGFGGNQFIYNAYNADYLDTRFQRSRWNWLAYWQMNVSLPADFKVEFGGWYMTKFLEEFFDIEQMGGINLGVSKTFLDKRARISLSLNDLLYTQQSRVSVDFADVVVAFRSRDDSRNARLTFSYQFGNTKVKAARRRGGGADAENSRVKVE